MYERKQVDVIYNKLLEKRRRIIVLMGPRQTGKTTAMRQVADKYGRDKVHYFSADNLSDDGNGWIVDKWETIRRMISLDHNVSGHVLVLDEVQKVKGWSEAVKAEWDYDTEKRIDLKVVLLGSSRLLLKKGLDDSLCGRFYPVSMNMWSYKEMHDAFGFSLDEFIYFGGFPGLAPDIKSEAEWRNLIGNGIISPMLERDLHQIEEIRNPALMRNVFAVGSIYSAQELSVSKMQGEINSGSNPTIANYLDILNGAMMLKPIYKYSSVPYKVKSSIPKFQVYNNGFKAYFEGLGFAAARHNPVVWGRYVESSVGAHLLNESLQDGIEVLYWRDKVRNNQGQMKDSEIDFILKKGTRYFAIEVKTRRSENTLGTAVISTVIPGLSGSIIVGPDDFPLERFFNLDIDNLFEGKFTSKDDVIPGREQDNITIIEEASHDSYKNVTELFELDGTLQVTDFQKQISLVGRCDEPIQNSDGVYGCVQKVGDALLFQDSMSVRRCIEKTGVDRTDGTFVVDGRKYSAKEGVDRCMQILPYGGGIWAKDKDGNYAYLAFSIEKQNLIVTESYENARREAARQRIEKYNNAEQRAPGKERDQGEIPKGPKLH